MMYIHNQMLFLINNSCMSCTFTQRSFIIYVNHLVAIAFAMHMPPLVEDKIIYHITCNGVASV